MIDLSPKVFRCRLCSEVAMASPADIADIIKVNASISSGGGVAQQSFSEPVFISEFATNASFTGRVKPYVGTLAEMQASLIADEFAANDPAYRQITIAKVQLRPPDVIYIGRTDPADITYADALTAIWAAASADDQSLFFACVDERDTAAIEAIADWVNQRDFVFYMAATAAQSVYQNQANNVCANIIAKGYDSTALVWHDSAVASNYGPATLMSLRGPFVLPSVSGNFKFRIDGLLEQDFILTANAATVAGVTAGPHVVANGDAFSVTIDAGALQTIIALLLPATNLSGLSETFEIEPNTTLQASFDGEAAIGSTFTATRGTSATADEPYAFAPADSVTYAIDGGPNQVLDFTGVGATRVDVKTKLDELSGVTVVDTGSSVDVTSLTYGTGSDVEIVAGTANALAELGLAVSNNVGTGFAANLAAVSAADLATKLDGDWTAKAAVTVSGTQVLITSKTIGKSSRIRVLESVANNGIEFATNEFAGSGTFNNGAAVTTTELVTWMSDELFSVAVSNDANKVSLLTRSRGTLSKIDIPASTLQATLGFSIATTASVGSNVNDASVVAASEISSVIALTLTDGTTAAASSAFTVSSLIDGPTSTIDITGGTYAELLLGDTVKATGTGTAEDYIDCAYVGRMSTLPLDSPNGQASWDGAPLVGLFTDSIPSNIRKVLHETLKVNTYEVRLGNSEMHFGTVLWGQTTKVYRYIDQVVTLAWGWARSVETFKSTLTRLSANKNSAPNTDDGIQILANDWKRFLATGQTNGHWIYDDSPINSETDTGITIPTRAQQSANNVSLRQISGFAVRFQFLDSIHRVDADLQLTSFGEITVAA